MVGVLEVEGAIEALVQGLLLEESNPRRGQDGSAELQRVCAEALQELATMGYIGGSSSAQRRNGMTSFSGKVPPGKGRKGRKNTARGTPRRPPPIGS